MPEPDKMFGGQNSKIYTHLPKSYWTEPHRLKQGSEKERPGMLNKSCGGVDRYEGPIPE
jgi:hypothetical protein